MKKTKIICIVYDWSDGNLYVIRMWKQQRKKYT